MKAILVDDEPLALDHLDKLLKENSSLNIVGKYTNPHEALKMVLQYQPDVVFLDIEMPEMSGIDMAEIIQTSTANIHIIFITAHNEYAVKAFEINAVDYVMKPVESKRLAETVRRLSKHTTPANTFDRSHMVCCFQTLQFVSLQENIEVVDVKWRTSKARELFAFLIQHRQRPVRREVIVELFWPESDLDKGYAQLYATIYQIRKMIQSIGFHITITSADQSYTLDLNEVKLDVEEWEKGMSELLKVSKESLLKDQSILNLYRGDYLIEEGYLWAESERERLRTLWLTYIEKVSDHLVSKKNYTDAILLYQRMQAIHPYSEMSYSMLMKLYDVVGDYRSVKRQYVRLKSMMLDEYGMEPKTSIQMWYESWKSATYKK